MSLLFDGFLGGSYEGNNPFAYYFVAGRMRTPTQTGAPAARYSAHKLEFISPDYPTNNFRCAFPSHYTVETGTLPTEQDAPATCVIEGHSLQAYIGGSWVNVSGTFSGSSSVTLDPTTNAVGALGDDIVFTGGIPPNTRMAVVVCIDVASGNWIGGVPNRTGTFEGAFSSASSTIAMLTDNTAFGGTGRIAGRVYGPSYIVAKATNGLSRPVWFLPGDSIGYGKNENENVLPSAAGDYGFMARALGDSSRSKRMEYNNVCVPGAGPSEWGSRSGWSRKLDLIRLCPNRPYTHIMTEHYNNSMNPDYAGVFKPMMKTYYALLKSESQAWGTPAAPIYQTRVLPRPGSTDWCTTLAGMTPPSSGNAIGDTRFLFDDDLAANAFPELAGAITTNTLYAYDTGSNRDKLAITGFQTTLAASATGGATSVSLTDSVNVGDFIVFAPSGTYNGGAHVTSVTGTGPYTAGLAIGVSAMSSGIGVRKSYSGDSVGLHPATPGAKLIAEPIIDWKNTLWP